MMYMGERRKLVILICSKLLYDESIVCFIRRGRGEREEKKVKYFYVLFIEKSYSYIYHNMISKYSKGSYTKFYNFL